MLANRQIIGSPLDLGEFHPRHKQAEKSSMIFIVESKTIDQGGRMMIGKCVSWATRTSLLYRQESIRLTHWHNTDNESDQGVYCWIWSAILKQHPEICDPYTLVRTNQNIEKMKYIFGFTIFIQEVTRQLIRAQDVILVKGFINKAQKTMLTAWRDVPGPCKKRRLLPRISSSLYAVILQNSWLTYIIGMSGSLQIFNWSIECRANILTSADLSLLC